jgi:hypothetical protein
MANHAERCRPLERVNYFTGQLLSAGDLQAEQEYVRALYRRHLRMCHGWGVVEGLVVVGGEGVHQIVVEPGFALSPDGSEICIPHRVELELRPLRSASAVEYLAVRAIETKVDPDRVVGVGDAGESQYSRLRESFEIAVLDGLPGSHERGHGGKSFLPAWQWIRCRLSGRRSSGRRPGHRPTNAPGATPDDDWVVLAKLVRTRVAHRDERVRFAPGARRHVR